MKSEEKMSWRFFDGYHARYQLIDNATGKILAEVYGSTHQAENGWSSRVEPDITLGRYVSSREAKLAAEKYINDTIGMAEIDELRKDRERIEKLITMASRCRLTLVHWEDGTITIFDDAMGNKLSIGNDLREAIDAIEEKP